MRCPECRYDIDIENELVEFAGSATVYGATTLRKFNDEGIVWNVSDSCNEEIKCPNCGLWIIPDMIEVRK